MRGYVKYSPKKKPETEQSEKKIKKTLILKFSTISSYESL